MVSWRVFKSYKNGTISVILLKSVPMYKKLPHTLYAVTVDCQYLIMKHKCYKLISQCKQIRECEHKPSYCKKEKKKKKDREENYVIFKPCSIDKINHCSWEKLKSNESTSFIWHRKKSHNPETSGIYPTTLSGKTLVVHSKVRRETLSLKRCSQASKNLANT